MAVACRRISMACPASAARLGEVDDIGGQRRANVAVRLRGVVQEAQLQGDEAVRAQLHGLRDLALLPVPEREGVPVGCGHIRRVEALQAQWLN